MYFIFQMERKPIGVFEVFYSVFLRHQTKSQHKKNSNIADGFLPITIFISDGNGR